jgi:hypothetical protein
MEVRVPVREVRGGLGVREREKVRLKEGGYRVGSSQLSATSGPSDHKAEQSKSYIYLDVSS